MNQMVGLQSGLRETEATGRKPILQADWEVLKPGLSSMIFLLRIIGIPVSRDEKPYLFYTICALLWGLYLMLVIYTIGFDLQNEYFASVAANHIWMLHSTFIYTSVGIAMCNDSSLFKMINDMATEHDDPNQDNEASRNAKLINKLSWIGVGIAIFSALSNLVAVSYVYFIGYFYEIFPLVRSDYWLGVMILFWYFYSFGSSLSIPFVLVPTMLFSSRISKFVSHLENASGDDLLDDFDRLTTWYDNLYKVNRRLNQQVSFLVTANIALCAPLTVFEILILVNSNLDGAAKASGATWIFLNIMLLLIVCVSVALIDGQRNKVLLAVGSQSLSKRADSSLVHFQCMVSKINANPLGVYVYGTTLPISMNNILKISSLTLSLFLFLIGLRGNSIN